MSSRIVNALRSLLIGIVIVAATLVMLEGAASLLLFLRDYRSASAPASVVRPLTMPDTLLGWANKPNYHNANQYGRGVGLTINAQRMRDTGPVDSTKAARLVCSGDS